MKIDAASVPSLSRRDFVSMLALAGAAAPRVIISESAKVKGVPFMGDPAANLQVLLPDEPGYDLAVNIFAYQPGGHLPFVEAHIMEHGLLMLDGAGVYRLEDSWYPVQAGDVILAVGGVPTAGQPLDAVVGRIRGPAGTPVVISFQRGGQSFELTMRRKLLNL
jgi:glyoxylate utilization-related uncharacterized protein